MKAIALFLRVCAVLCFLLAPGLALADSAAAPAQPATAARSTGLPLPRFVSLKSGKAYMRTGPDLRYPIKWVYQRAGMPVEITQEYDVWRKIRDFEGDEGWVHQSMLSGERHVIVVGKDLALMRDSVSDNGRLVARLEPGVIATVGKCNRQSCQIDTGDYQGWVTRKYLWGIYANENLN